MWRRVLWGGGGFGGGWANSVRVDVPFMWMFRSCGCFVHVDVGTGFACSVWRRVLGGGVGGGGLIPFVWMFRSCGCFVHVDVAVMSFINCSSVDDECVSKGGGGWGGY